MPDPVLDFAETFRGLLDLEREAEAAEARRQRDEIPGPELQRRGVTLRRLLVTDLRPGLGGRIVVVLERPDGDPLPVHRFTPGDVVGLRTVRDDRPTDQEISGVVDVVKERSIEVALDEDDQHELPSLVRLDRLSPDVTWRRMLRALARLPGRDLGDARKVRDAAFADAPPSFGTRPAIEELVWRNESLDASQRDAVAFALRADRLALIHGPPGTGKTTAVVEVICQAVERGEKVLATAPSNVAVDNLVERLVAQGVRAVRIGHPARVLEAVREHSLDALVEAASDPSITRALKKDLQHARRAIDRADSKTERREARQALKELQREQRRLEDSIVRGVLDTAEVVLATLTGCDDRMLRERMFELTVVDEAAQALEPATWIALLKARRAVLAGDHLQLAPMIRSAEAERQGLGRTLFARLTERHGEAITRMLTVQYRMHEAIMDWSSQALYDGRLEAHDSVRNHRLADLDGVHETELTAVPAMFLDTAGCGLDESEDSEDKSKSNPGEADLVASHVLALREAGVAATDIAVITPYNAQVQLLRERLAGELAHEGVPGLEVGTVDGFQGREKEAVVLTTVRSNPDGEVGFLKDARRMNVAVTRARRHITLVGDSATLCCDPFLAGLVDHLQERGVYRSAWELLDK